MAQFCGKFSFKSSDDQFDEFLKACGVSLVFRKAGAMSKPVVEIKLDGDEYSIKTSTTFKNSEIKFKLDEEFEETRLDGSICKTKISLEDGKLVQKQTGDDKDVTIIREVEGDEMKTICKINDIVSTRVYSRCD